MPLDAGGEWIHDPDRVDQFILEAMAGGLSDEQILNALKQNRTIKVKSYKHWRASKLERSVYIAEIFKNRQRDPMVRAALQLLIDHVRCGRGQNR